MTRQHDLMDISSILSTRRTKPLIILYKAESPNDHRQRAHSSDASSCWHSVVFKTLKLCKKAQHLKGVLLLFCREFEVLSAGLGTSRSTEPGRDARAPAATQPYLVGRAGRAGGPRGRCPAAGGRWGRRRRALRAGLVPPSPSAAGGPGPATRPALPSASPPRSSPVPALERQRQRRVLPRQRIHGSAARLPRRPPPLCAALAASLEFKRPQSLPPSLRRAR